MDAGHDLTLNRDTLSGEDLLRVGGAGRDAAVVLHFAWNVLQKVRSQLDGFGTELVLWPHGFDSAFLWFETAEGSDEQSNPHIGIGFSPGSTGLDRPYFYLYAWPLRSESTVLELPSPAHWHAGTWTGVVIGYDDVRLQGDPEGFAIHLLLRVFRALRVDILDSGS